MKITDIPFLVKDINKKMSVYTSSSAKISYSSFNFPKNFKEQSDKSQLKFLDNHHHQIEEARYAKLLSEEFLNWYLWQNINYHNFEILKGDAFFTSRMREGFRKNINPNFAEIHNVGRFNFHSVAFLASLKHGCTGQTEITGGADESTNSDAVSLILAAKLSAATIGNCVNRGKVKQVLGTGYNYKIAIYDDSGTAPNNLGSESASTSGADSTYVNIPLTTEYSIATAQNWGAIKADNATWSFRTANNSLANQRKYKAHNTYDFPNPFGSPTSDGYPHLCAFSHS